MSIDHGKVLALADRVQRESQIPSKTSQPARLRVIADELRALAQPAEAVEAKWVTDLRNEAVRGSMKDVYWLSRDQVFELIGDATGRKTPAHPDVIVARATDAAQGAVAWQINATKSHRGWESCTRECYEDTLRTGRYMGLSTGTRDVEVRPLYTHPQADPAQGDGVGLIAAERRRQIEAESWTPEHDDVHTDGSLAVAAACYATQANQGLYENGNKARDAMLRYWPWDAKWWKPTPQNRIRELVKAGALIAAEIDRLQRAASPSQEVRADPGIEVGGTQHGPAPSQEGE